MTLEQQEPTTSYITTAAPQKEVLSSNCVPSQIIRMDQVFLY